MIDDRRALEFETSAIEAFSWLTDLGYEVVGRSATLVDFEDAASCVRVYHGRSSGELGVELWRKESPEEVVSLCDVIRLSAPEAAREYRNPMVATKKGVAKFLDLQSKRLSQYGRELLAGDSLTWRRLAKEKSIWMREYWAERRLSSARRHAVEAFRRREFAEVVDLLAPFEERLTPAEMKKLAYARKQSEGQGD